MTPHVRINSFRLRYINTGIARYGAEMTGTTVEELARTYLCIALSHEVS